MVLADRLAQYRTPFVVQSTESGAITHLHSAAECAREIRECPVRFVMSDDLTRLCTALAYSKGVRTLDCADLLHVPAEHVWVEWCQAPWERELASYGFTAGHPPVDGAARRGALIRSSKDGRRGSLRTFWSSGDEEVMAGCMEAYFDLDTPAGEEPQPPDHFATGFTVADRGASAEHVLARCFRFRYDPTWASYYAQAQLGAQEKQALSRHALGTIAIDIPMLLLFFLLLATRTGLPKREETFERLNRVRLSKGNAPLLAHIEVKCPLLPDHSAAQPSGATSGCRSRRLHHVRGHLFRRGGQLFWRVPHLRGDARAGSVHTRTVTWTF
jgi:hypothetical protein